MDRNDHSQSKPPARETFDGWDSVARIGRVGWTVAQIVVLELAVCGVAALPSVALWMRVIGPEHRTSVRLVLSALLIIPSYALFALMLMGCSALATRLTGARTPPDAELRIRDMEWPLLRWVRYMVAGHVVRVLAGGLFRGSPIWTAYLRLNGARIGRGVYVNTLSIADHSLLSLGDAVVIGADVHVSGHTVERGVLRTGRVALGPGVTVGLGTAIEIDVEVGAGCQIGALSLVPKHARLEPHAVYVGIPVRKLKSASEP
jgi:acetyltransferase-like isoleucine patch superfamily enzyme